MRFDLHVHTTISSCSKLDVDDILNYAREFGLDGVCITDHDCMEIRRYLDEGMQPNGLCVIFGMEYSTSDGDFLIFGPFEELLPGLSDMELLKTVEHAGGVAVAAHPLRTGRSVREKIFQSRQCHLAETVNGRNSDIENLKAERLQNRYQFGETGGSDAHTLEELGHIITCFDTPVWSRSDLIYALRHHKCRPERNIWRQPFQKAGSY